MSSWVTSRHSLGPDRLADQRLRALDAVDLDQCHARTLARSGGRSGPSATNPTLSQNTAADELRRGRAGSPTCRRSTASGRVAVLAVFFYHVGADWMPGGFLGVDVFFVISGYLITALLLSEFEQARPHRRARLLAAPRPAAAPGGRGDDRGGLIVAALFVPGGDRRPARGRGRLALLRQQLAPRPHRPVVLRGLRAAVAVPPPVVAVGRGAVLPPLAAVLRGRPDGCSAGAASSTRCSAGSSPRRC